MDGITRLSETISKLSKLKKADLVFFFNRKTSGAIYIFFLIIFFAVSPGIFFKLNFNFFYFLLKKF